MGVKREEKCAARGKKWVIVNRQELGISALWRRGLSLRGRSWGLRGVGGREVFYMKWGIFCGIERESLQPDRPGSSDCRM